MNKNIKLMTVTALLAAMSIILSYFEIPIIPAFPFLKLDFAEVAIILCSVLQHPWALSIVRWYHHPQV